MIALSTSIQLSSRMRHGLLVVASVAATFAGCRSNGGQVQGPELPPALSAETPRASPDAADANERGTPPPREDAARPEPERKPVVVQVRTPESDAREAAAATTENTAGAHAGHGDAPAIPAAPGVMPNRDKHGNADVERYISGLQRADRISDLKIDVVLDKLELPTDAVIGDLGCGPGIFTIPFARKCPEGVVYASDIEPRQLDVVREKLRASNLRNIVPVLASEDDPHFPPAQLDIVFVADTYHHIDDRVTYFERVAKTLKPGGRLVILDYKPGSLPVGPPADHKPAAGVRAKELTSAGWKLVESFDTHRWQDFEVWRRLQPWEKK